MQTLPPSHDISNCRYLQHMNTFRNPLEQKHIGSLVSPLQQVSEFSACILTFLSCSFCCSASTSSAISGLWSRLDPHINLASGIDLPRHSIDDETKPLL